MHRKIKTNNLCASLPAIQLHAKKLKCGDVGIKPYN